MLYRAHFLIDVQAVPDVEGVEPDYYLLHWPTGHMDQITVEEFNSPVFKQLFSLAESQADPSCSRHSSPG